MSNRHHGKHHSSSHESRTKVDSKHESNDRHHSSKSKHRSSSQNNRNERDREASDKHRKHNDDREKDSGRRNRHRSRSRSRSPIMRIKREVVSDDEQNQRNSFQNRSKNRPRSPNNNRSRRRRPNDKKEDENYEWGKAEDKVKKEEDNPAEPKAKPNFGLSGKLAEDTNTFNGIVIKYNEPVEARKPKRRWRLYPFKGETSLPFIPIHRQSAYLLGRERAVCDIPTDHPSCSKQHAVLQFRLVDYNRDDGTIGKRVRPYIIDLESANGTFVNNNKIDPKRYFELMEQDVVKFGYSTREYVILHENSKGETEDDDVTVSPPKQEEET